MSEPRQYDLKWCEGERDNELGPYWRVATINEFNKHREGNIHVIEYSAFREVLDKLQNCYCHDLKLQLATAKAEVDSLQNLALMSEEKQRTFTLETSDETTKKLLEQIGLLQEKLEAANNRIAILESKKSQYESTIKETIRIRDAERAEERARGEKLREALESVRLNYMREHLNSTSCDNCGSKVYEALASYEGGS